MALVDWFLKRSDEFKLLITRFKHHKFKTMESFSRVREDNRRLAKKIVEHEFQIRELRDRLNELGEEQPTTIKIERKIKK